MGQLIKKIYFLDRAVKFNMNFAVGILFLVNGRQISSEMVLLAYIGRKKYLSKIYCSSFLVLFRGERSVNSSSTVQNEKIRSN